MTDDQIAAALQNVRMVTTLTRRIANHIMEVGNDYVVVQSSHPGAAKRTILYNEIRRARDAVWNGSVVRALAAHLGLPY